MKLQYDSDVHMLAVGCPMVAPVHGAMGLNAKGIFSSKIDHDRRELSIQHYFLDSSYTVGASGSPLKQMEVKRKCLGDVMVPGPYRVNRQDSLGLPPARPVTGSIFFR